MVWSKDTTYPLCLVEFYTETTSYRATGSGSVLETLMSINTSKALDSPAGTWSVDFLGDIWYKRLKPQDLVVIQMGRRPGNLDTVMVGLVDEVRRKRGVGNNGQQTIHTSIVGRDMGKVFLKAFIKWFPQFLAAEFTIPELTNVMTKMIQFFTKHSYQVGTPANLIDNAIRNMLPALINTKVTYNGVKSGVPELLQYTLGKTNNTLPIMTMMSDFEGALWNYFTSVQNRPFFELFVDTRKQDEKVVADSDVEKKSDGFGKFSAVFGEDKSVASLYLRSTPFDSDDWDTLHTTKVKDEDIISEDLGISDHENFNMFQAVPTHSLLDSTAYGAAVKPRFNGESILRHGISHMEVSVNGLFNEQNGITDNTISVGKALSNQLKSWFERNIEFENGSITIRGNGEVKIGQRLLNEDTSMVYYVETVSQSFRNLSNWYTTLGVTRGQRFRASTAPSQPRPNVPRPNVPRSPEVKKAAPYHHKVVTGDTLWSLAGWYYNNPRRWPEIFEANREMMVARDRRNLKQPGHWIFPGQRLLIPNTLKTQPRTRR